MSINPSNGYDSVVPMKTMDKLIYEMPSIEVVKVTTEHFLCVSGVEASRSTYGAAVEDTWD